MRASQYRTSLILAVLCELCACAAASSAPAGNIDDSCAVAVTYFLLRYFGVDVSVSRVADELKLDERGFASLHDIQRTAEAHGLKVAGVRANPSQLQNIRLPCVLPLRLTPENSHVTEDVVHFVVVLGYDEAIGYRAVDPSSSSSPFRICSEMLREAWHGEVLIFSKSDEELAAALASFK